MIFTKRQRYPIGVRKDRNSYIASVSEYGTKKYIGSFKTEKEAYNAYKNSMYNYKVEEND